MSNINKDSLQDGVILEVKMEGAYIRAFDAKGLNLTKIVSSKTRQNALNQGKNIKLKKDKNGYMRWSLVNKNEKISSIKIEKNKSRSSSDLINKNETIFDKIKFWLSFAFLLSFGITVLFVGTIIFKAWLAKGGSTATGTSGDSETEIKKTIPEIKEITLKDEIIGQYIWKGENCVLTIDKNSWSEKCYEGKGEWSEVETGSYSLGKDWYDTVPKQYDYIQLNNHSNWSKLMVDRMWNKPDGKILQLRWGEYLEYEVATRQNASWLFE